MLSSVEIRMIQYIVHGFSKINLTGLLAIRLHIFIMLSIIIDVHVDTL